MDEKKPEQTQTEDPSEESMVSYARDVLLRSEKYVDWLDRKAEIDARLHRVQVEIDAATEAEFRARQKWQVLKQNALIEGSAIPPKPAPVDKSHLDEVYRDVWLEQRQHAERKGWAIIDAMEHGGLETLRAEQAEAEAAVVAIWEKTLMPLLQGFADRARVVREYEREKAGRSNTMVGAPRVDRITAKPDLYDVLAAAHDGRCLLDPAPVGASERKIERIESGYGLQSNGTFASGYADHDRPPPPPLPRWMTDDHSRGVLG